MPKQSFSHTATAAASVGQVWAALDEPATWESIGGVDRVFNPTVDELGRLQGFSFETVVGGTTYIGEAKPSGRVEGRSMTWAIANKEIRGTIAVQLGEAGPNTELTVTIDLESAGFMSAMFFPVIAGAVGRGLPDAVDDFASGFGSSGDVSE